MSLFRYWPGLLLALALPAGAAGLSDQAILSRVAELDARQPSLTARTLTVAGHDTVGYGFARQLIVDEPDSGRRYYFLPGSLLAVREGGTLFGFGQNGTLTLWQQDGQPATLKPSTRRQREQELKREGAELLTAFRPGQAEFRVMAGQAPAFADPSERSRYVCLDRIRGLLHASRLDADAALLLNAAGADGPVSARVGTRDARYALHCQLAGNGEVQRLTYRPLP
ncbi:hypothetical protein OL229_20155 [Neisseriaceae bacterium JH1-16]|nr:hypothetical protein [Neisseriaceae bacterium JH1-16]